MGLARSFHYKLLSLAAGLGVSLFPAPVRTYEPGKIEGGSIHYNTHSLLTKKTVELWNQQNPDKQLDLEAVVTGTIQEDSEEAKFIRAYNHFCDFQTKEGVFGFPCSKDWAQSPELQAGKVPLDNFTAHGPAEFQRIGLDGDVLSELMRNKYQFEVDDYDGYYPYGDQTWQKAIVEKDQKALGHVLHLIQDLTVPAHSRNDVHPEFYIPEFHGDSYEVWAGSSVEKKVELLDSSPLSPRGYNSLEEIFNEVNEFVGSNFFSDDTVKRYSTPNVESLAEERVGCTFLTRLNGTCTYYTAQREGKKIPLLRKGWLGLHVIDNQVLQEYWKILGRKAVEAGLAIIDLYFREITAMPPAECSDDDCPGSGCVFYDQFSGNALDPCKWKINSGTPVVANGQLQLSGGSAITSTLEPRTCSKFSLTYDSRSEGPYYISIGDVQLAYASNEYPTFLTAACSSTWRVVPEVDVSQWNTITVEKEGTQITILVNSQYVLGFTCNQQSLGNMYINGPNDSSAFTINNVKETCL